MGHQEIGALARPDDIRFADVLPKTAAAKSCAAFCGSWPEAGKSKATPRRWKTWRAGKAPRRGRSLILVMCLSHLCPEAIVSPVILSAASARDSAGMRSRKACPERSRRDPYLVQVYPITEQPLPD